MNWTTTPIIGLPNTGTICYFNSIIQALFGCPSFVRYIRYERPQEWMDILYERCSGANLVLLNEINKHTGNRFHGQQCGHEFLIHLIDYLQHTLHKEKIHTLFAIEYDSKLYCKKCNLLKKTQNDLMYTIHVPEQYQGTIEEIITAGYTKIEGYTCDQHHPSSYQYKLNILQQLPYILIIVFNKFYKKKNMIYPSTLSIPTLEKTHTYTLVSVVDHYGTKDSGHYVCRSIRNQKIFLFDDARIFPDSSLHSMESAYLLFYHIM